MSVYDYLDLEQATKRILRGWNDRVWAQEHNAEKIEVIRARLTKTTQSVGSAPVKGGTSAKEEQWVNGISAIDELEKEIRRADETQREVERCWDRLTEDERFVLREVFVDGTGIESVKNHFHVEKSEAYSRVKKALKRFSKLLFWG